MRIKYNKSIDDSVAFVLFYYRHATSIRLKAIMWGILFSVGIFVISCIVALQRNRGDLAFFGALFAGLFMLFLLRGREQRLEKAVRKMFAKGSNKILLGEHELEITEAGLVSRSEYGEGKYTWDVIERVGFTPDYAFVFIGAANGLPTAKSSVIEGDFEAFGEELRRRFEEKVFADDTEQKRDLDKLIITDTEKIYKGDMGFGKHSGRGIASFAIAMIAGVLYLSVLGLMFILAFVGQELVGEVSIMLQIFTVTVTSGFVANIAGIVFGIIGVCQENRKKLFAVLGIVFNTIGVISLVLLAIIFG